MAPQKAVLKFALSCSLKEELTVYFMLVSNFYLAVDQGITHTPEYAWFQNSLLE